MKQVPCSGAKAQEFFLLAPLRFGGVSSSSKRTSIGGVGTTGGQSWVWSIMWFRSMAQGRATVVLFILAARTATGCSLGGMQHGLRRRDLGDRRCTVLRRRFQWWGMRVTTVVDNTWEEVFTSTRKFLDCLFRRTVLARSVRVLSRTARKARGWHGRKVVRVRRV